MSYFVVFATDRPGMDERRERLRPAHREYLRCPQPHGVRVCLGGPTLDSEGQRMNGTLLVVQAASRTEVEAFLQDDPYIRNDLFAHLEVRPWLWGLGLPVQEAAP